MADAGAGLSLVDEILDVINPFEWYYKERSADEERERRKLQEKLGTRRLDISEEEQELQEKQRAFQRLASLMKGGARLQDRASAATRLRMLRSSGGAPDLSSPIGG